MPRRIAQQSIADEVGLAPRRDTPGIPEPVAETDALYSSVSALKIVAETLLRQRGDIPKDSALRGSDLEAIVKYLDRRYLIAVEVDVFSATITDDAGDGSAHGDLNATDFTGHPNAVGTALSIETDNLVTFAHKVVAYLWTGPVPVSVGSGGTHTAVAGDLTPIGTADHNLLDNRDLLDQHPQSAVTGLVADQGVQDGRLGTLETRADETDTEQGTQDGRLDTLETRADEADTEQGTQGGRLDALELGKLNRSTAFSTFVFAGYLGLESPIDSPFPDLGVAWQDIGIMTIEGVPGRGVTFLGNGQFTVDVDGIYFLATSGTFEHNSSNQGRITRARIYNYTDGVGDVGIVFGTGRNAEATSLVATGFFDIGAGEVGKTLGLQIGNGDTYTSVNFQTMAAQIFNVGIWQGTPPA